MVINIITTPEVLHKFWDSGFAFWEKLFILMFL